MSIQLPKDWKWDNGIKDFASLKQNVLRLKDRKPKGYIPILSIMGDVEAVRKETSLDFLSNQVKNGLLLDSFEQMVINGYAIVGFVRCLIRQRDFISECIHLKTIPPYRLKFIDPLIESREEMNEWMETQPWDNPWVAGNSDMDIAYFLAYEWKVLGNEKAFDALDQWFKWHDKNIDPVSGYWDPKKMGNLRHIMAGGMHQFAIYFMFNHEVPYPEKAAETVLVLQEETGLFSDETYSNNCLDIDSVFMLTNLYRKYHVKESEIKLALERAFEANLKCFHPEGGAVNRVGVDKDSDWWSTWCRVSIVGWCARILGIKEFLGPWDFRPRHPFQCEDGGASMPDWISDAWNEAADWPRAK